MPLPENNILFYWTALDGRLFCVHIEVLREKRG